MYNATASALSPFSPRRDRLRRTTMERVPANSNRKPMCGSSTAQIMPTGPFAARSIGRTSMERSQPPNLRTDSEAIERKCPFATRAIRATPVAVTMAGRGSSSPIARNTSVSNSWAWSSGGGSAQGSLIRSASLIRRRRAQGFLIPAMRSAPRSGLPPTVPGSARNCDVRCHALLLTRSIELIRKLAAVNSPSSKPMTRRPVPRLQRRRLAPRAVDQEL